MEYTNEVKNMCKVAIGASHGCAPIPQEGEWTYSRQITDISGLSHGTDVWTTNAQDLVGGVTINSDKAFDSYHMPGWRVKKGDNFMDGAKALAYSRERYAYRSGDRHRIKNQQQVLAAVIDKLSSSTTLLTDYDKVLKSLNNFYVTDIPKGLITQAVKTQLDDMSEWKIESQSVSGSDASKPTRTAPNSKRYVMIPYEKDVNNASAKIKSLINKK